MGVWCVGWGMSGAAVSWAGRAVTDRLVLMHLSEKGLSAAPKNVEKASGVSPAKRFQSGTRCEVGWNWCSRKR